ncbi:MAG: universal stress protein [Nocardioidaceae bacterium]|nr:universal stress protein [Nocardioidaceae bacterium]
MNAEVVDDVVLVGVDHTDHGRAALRLGARRAVDLGCGLRVVRVLEPGLAPRLQDTRTTLHNAARGATAWVFDELAGMEHPPDVEISSLVGDPMTVLLAQSAHARELVVGSPASAGRALADPLLNGLRRHAQCLVVEASPDAEIVRATGPEVTTPGSVPLTVGTRNIGPVLVGFDGSAHAVAALGWAVGQAAASGTAVRVVSVVGASDSAEQRAAVHRAQADAVEAAEVPVSVAVTCDSVEGEAVDVLVTAAMKASHLVLGRHGVSSMIRGSLSSVGDACSRLATCPVTIVP